MRPYRLQGQYELVIGKALVDRDIATALLADPVSTGMLLGLCDTDAALLAGIREKDLTAFARTLVRRLSQAAARQHGHAQPRATERLMRASGE
jgi:carbamate kinase